MLLATKTSYFTLLQIPLESSKELSDQAHEYENKKRRMICLLVRLLVSQYSSMETGNSVLTLPHDGRQPRDQGNTILPNKAETLACKRPC
jgi:hypothetical protein